MCLNSFTPFRADGYTLRRAVKLRNLQEMVDLSLFTPQALPSEALCTEVVNFLHEHLDQYGDPSEHIAACLDFALGKASGLGGFVVVARDGEGISGVTVVNRTGMKGYIPENILVYIATHRRVRGQGVGKALMLAAIDHTEGDIALHVEPDNPARFLYEKLGFTSKYLEMRRVHTPAT